MQMNKPNAAVSFTFSEDIIHLELCVERAVHSKQFKALSSSTRLRQNQTLMWAISGFQAVEPTSFQALCYVLEYTQQCSCQQSVHSPEDVDKKIDHNCLV